ncbi:MAG: hypothetical protein WCK96_01840 [Methylococcales bacterium]
MEFNSFRDCESIHNFKQTTLLDATIFKPVILAWMPESSAKDGNYMIINNIVLHAVSHPCDWIPASMLE